MAKSKHASPAKRKKAHKPKGFDRNAAFHTIRANWKSAHTAANDALVAGAMRSSALRARFADQINDEQQEELANEYASAMARMRLNTGDMDDWSAVIQALNTGLVLAERGFGAEYLPTFMQALDALAAARIVYLETGKWSWTDADNTAINDGIDVHAAQLEVAMQADVLSAIAEVAKRIEEHQVIIKKAA
jgi:hypothetical protein